MADLELESLGNGDGNNYLLRDNTKIPLSGSNQISGSLIPTRDNAYDFGSSGYRFFNIFGYYLHTAFIYSYDNTSQVAIYGGTSYQNGAEVTAYGKDHPYNSGCVNLIARDGTNTKAFTAKPDGTLTWDSKNVAMQEDVVPRSGGAVMTTVNLARTVSDANFQICGGTGWDSGGVVGATGKNKTGWAGGGSVYLHPSDGSIEKEMLLYSNGTWTWNGTSCQITSDQRYKQQISEIDDKLLDAWEDVEPVQFKYNDAVEEKSDKARLHTGYVVQQIDTACKSHNVDISAYGLYCHEEYPEETEEVEVEQADGTKVKETKVIREANEYYSLRYTEALIVECAYLRKKNKDLQEQLNSLSERLEKLENR